MKQSNNQKLKNKFACARANIGNFNVDNIVAVVAELERYGLLSFNACERELFHRSLCMVYNRQRAFPETNDFLLTSIIQLRNYREG